MRGFSLVELSIVLVILGLLTGGILAGQSLIRASEMRAVSTEYSRYITAIHSFRDKYFALPGDMTNATKLWGTAGACPGDNTTPSTTAATCDGTGDGTLLPGTTNSNEVFRAWQHLANAGLIEGTYAGVADSTTASDTTSTIGYNVPKSRLNSAGWAFGYLLPSMTTVSSAVFFEGTYGNVFFYASNMLLSSPSGGRILTPTEAWNIDSKTDDGMPALGKAVTWEYDGNAVCTDLAASTTLSRLASAYQLSNTAQTCKLIFKTGF